MTVRDRVELGFESWGRFVVRRSWWVLFASLLFTLGWALWIPHITFDNSTESFLLERDPASKRYREFRQQFGQDDHLMLAISPPEVFDFEFLARLRALHDALQSEVPHIQEVTSLINARQTRGEKDVLIVEELLQEWPETRAELADLGRRVLENPVYRNLLISEDGRVTTIMLKPVTYSSHGGDSDPLAGFDGSEAGAGAEPKFLSPEEKAQALAAVNEVVSRFRAADFPILVVGEIVIDQRLNEAMRRDVQNFIGVAVLAIGALVDDQARDGKLAAPRLGHRQQGVVDRSQGPPRNDEQRQTELRGHVRHMVFRRYGDQQPADALDDHELVPPVELLKRGEDVLALDLHCSALGRQVRRERFGQGDRANQ